MGTGPLPPERINGKLPAMKSLNVWRRVHMTRSNLSMVLSIGLMLVAMNARAVVYNTCTTNNITWTYYVVSGEAFRCAGCS